MMYDSLPLISSPVQYPQAGITESMFCIDKGKEMGLRLMEKTTYSLKCTYSKKACCFY